MYYIDFKKRADYIGNLDAYMNDNTKFMSDTLRFKGDGLSSDIDQYNRLKKAVKLMLAGKSPLTSNWASSARIAERDKNKPLQALYVETPYGADVVSWDEWKRMAQEAIRRDKKERYPDELNWMLRNSGFFYAKTGENAMGNAEPAWGGPRANMVKMFDKAYGKKLAPERIQKVRDIANSVLADVQDMTARQEKLDNNNYKAWQKAYYSIEDEKTQAWKKLDAALNG